MALVTLSGCSNIKPRVINLPSIPTYLADNSSYMPLKGHYYEKMPSNIAECHAELKLARIDVVNCIIGHRNNNAEMEAIRSLNK